MPTPDIQLFLFDVDGVLTDGGILVDASGQELVRFQSRDGLGLALLRRAGIEIGLLSGRGPRPAVEARARELGISLVLQGHRDKRTAFEALLQERSLSAEQVAYMGDDLVDLPILRRAGWTAAPADAAAEVRAQAGVVTEARGGHGAVREAIERLLNEIGKWQTIVAEAIG